MSTDTVCKIESVDIKVYSSSKGGSHSPAVSRIELSLDAGGIPTCHAIIDPYHTYKDTGDEAYSGSFALLAQNTKTLHELIQTGDAKVDLKIVVNHLNSPLGKQTVELKGWMLSAGGLSGYQASGFSFELEFHHPAQVLDHSVGNFINRANVIPVSKWLEAVGKTTNPVDGLGEALKVLAGVDKTTFSEGLHMPAIPAAGSGEVQQTLGESLKLIKGRIAAQAEAVKKHLVWGPVWPNNPVGYASFPLTEGTGALSGLKIASKQAYVRMCASLVTGSPLDVLTSTILGQYDLTIIPTYWMEQLGVSPSSPWARPVITISESELSTPINFPGVDPRPIGGVMVNVDLPAYSHVQTVAPGGTRKRDTTASLGSVVYIPKAYSDKGSSGGGAIVHLSTPDWLTTTMDLDRGLVIELEEDGRQKVTGKNTVDKGKKPGAGGGEKDTGGSDPGIYASAAQAYANAVFNAMFKVNSQITLTTRLMLQTDQSAWPSGYVIPGCVVRVMSGEDKKAKTLLDFYAIRVVHVIDVESGIANTKWQGTYCRAEGAYDKIVKTGTYNPLYVPK